MVAQKRFLIICLGVCLSVALIAVVQFGMARNSKSKETLRQETQEKILVYITEHGIGPFGGFELAVRELGLTHRQLSNHLLELERNNKIVCTPMYEARKPIIISKNDMIWYFGTVSVVTEE